MVLTRRAHKAITRWLPNEVITEIIQQAASGTNLVALSRVSKLFHGLSLPILYRNLHCKLSTAGYDSAMTLCATLSKTPSRAELVRSFVVEDMLEPLAHTGTLSPLLLKSLKLMRRLHHLSIQWDEGFSESVLEHCTFPDLRSCEITPPALLGPDTSTDLVASFLTRHPNLTRIRILSNAILRPSATLRIPMRHLQIYRGPANLLCSMDVVGLREARISRHGIEGPPLDTFITRLGAMAGADFAFFFSTASRDPALCTAVVDSVSRNIPDTGILQLCWPARDDVFDDELVARIATCLARCTMLKYLAFPIECDPLFLPVSTSPGPPTALQTWSSACPTLEGCVFADFVWAIVSGEWVACRTSDFVASGS
ncbi:hypothetical protein DFH07DRAFT_846254 [Mycena maculata]|uniref:F-box domain-containing protein n=1 Tax=Mycena maculata TaxID=230809 RepID=A0AAD7MU72_9AGAR|nr:hypothetical protein DFH07DRAFT_846254 [Mycena maculata]